MSAIHQQGGPETVNVVEPEEVIETLNDERISSAVFNDIEKRRVELRFGTLRALADPKVHEEWRKYEKLPITSLKAHRLRRLVDEWLNTGTNPDGSHTPEGRSLNRTHEARAAVKKSIAEYNPCRLLFIEKTGEVAVVVGWPNRDRPLSGLDRFQYALTDADRIFTAVMAEKWRSLLCKCRYCNRYYALANARRGSFPRGTFCCREHQRNFSAAACTKVRREQATAEFVEHAATWLTKQSAETGWSENPTLKRTLAVALSRRMSSNPNLRAGRECVGVNWVTRHTPEIEKRRLEIVRPQAKSKERKHAKS